MKTDTRVGAALAGLILMLAAAHPLSEAQKTDTIKEIRKEMMQLPYYGVFDFLAFSYDKGTVTLAGYAYHAGLKSDAERAVKRAPGVDTLVDKIEELPVSQFDDELRWKVYFAIYRDPFLSRYAPGGGMLWGHRGALGAGFHGGFAGPRFPGMEPLGDYPIHIIVKDGHVTLLGVVDNEGDKTIAGMKARQVPGSFAVENELMVQGAGQSNSK